jgi:taurine dioxygenase
MPMTIRPLNDAVGVEILDLDLSATLDDSDVSAIQDAFLEHHLLCFRTEPLPRKDFDRLARCFGEPQEQLLRHQRDGDVPTVSILDSTYKTAADKPDDMKQMRLTGWHTDDSYMALPAKATMLQSLQIPDSGGQTGFSNTRKAYDDLTDDVKAHCEGLHAVHEYDTKRAPARAKGLLQVEKDETPDVIHPLIRTNEESGKKAIYLNMNRTDQVEGMSREESDELLDFLTAQMIRPEYHYHHEWRVGDLLLWDNRCLVHSVNMDFPVGQTRLHQRILLKGVKPV